MSKTKTILIWDEDAGENIEVEVEVPCGPTVEDIAYQQMRREWGWNDDKGGEW